jgi:hypothetical protein
MAEGRVELQQGTIVFDEVREVVAVVMDTEGTRVYLRRPNGGVEWTRDRQHLRTPTTSERLSPRVSEANARSRGEL